MSRLRRAVTPPAERFVKVPNDWARDRRLSLSARGLLTLLLSYSDGFEVSVPRLVASNREGRAAIRAALAELREHGYLVMSQERGGDGRMSTDWEMTDPTPGVENRPRFESTGSDSPPPVHRHPVDRPRSAAPHKKTSGEDQAEDHSEDLHDERADARDEESGRATTKQLGYLRDLYVSTGRQVTAEVESDWHALSILDADRRIRRLRREHQVHPEVMTW